MRGGWTPVPAVPLSELSGSCPRARDPLQSSFALTPARSLSGAGLLPGFRSSSRHHRVRPLARGHSKPSIRSVRRCSQPLDGFLRHRLCGPVSSRSRVQDICSFRGSPSLRSRCFLIGSELPPCRCSPGRSPEQVWSPRSGALGFEAFVRAELAPRRVGS